MSAAGPKPRTAQVLQRKITILGFRGVGKSSLVKQWTEHRFDPEYEPTIIKVDRRRMDVGGIPFIFEIFDTAGQVRTCYVSWRDALGGPDGNRQDRPHPLDGSMLPGIRDEGEVAFLW